MWGFCVVVGSCCDSVTEGQHNQRVVIGDSKIGVQASTAYGDCPNPVRYAVRPSVAHNFIRGWRVGVPR
jgi:hypothetical protein